MRGVVRWGVLGLAILLTIAVALPSLASGNVLGFWLALVILAAALLLTDTWRLRSHLPLLGSPSVAQAALGWGLFGLVALVGAGIGAQQYGARPEVRAHAEGAAVARSATQSAMPTPEAPASLPSTPRPTAPPVASAPIPTAPPPATVAPTVAPAPEPPAPAPIETQVREIAQAQLSNGVRSVEVFQTNGRNLAMAAGRDTGSRAPQDADGPMTTYARVVYAPGMPINEGTAVREATATFQALAPRVFTVPDVDHLEFVVLGTFKDRRGNSSEDPAMVFSISRATAETINWAGVDGRDWKRLMPLRLGVTEGVWVHPAYQQAWDAYQR